MFWIELLVIGSLFATAWVFYRCGRRDGYNDGYIDGHNALAKLMTPTGAVRVIPPQP